MDERGTSETAPQSLGQAEGIALPTSPAPAPAVLTVLVVDDSALSRKMTIRLLRGLATAEGVDLCVLEGADGSEAITMMTQALSFTADSTNRPSITHPNPTVPDLVLMDAVMPHVGGGDATKALRGMGYKGPILAVTGHAGEEQHSSLIADGVTDVVVKPLTAQRIQPMIHSLMKHSV